MGLRGDNFLKNCKQIAEKRNFLKLENYPLPFKPMRGKDIKTLVQKDNFLVLHPFGFCYFSKKKIN